ncbi:hypothetical protein D3C75_958070 [compost metagenome]
MVSTFPFTWPMRELTSAAEPAIAVKEPRQLTTWLFCFTIMSWLLESLSPRAVISPLKPPIIRSIFLDCSPVCKDKTRTSSAMTEKPLP